MPRIHSLQHVPAETRRFLRTDSHGWLENPPSFLANNLLGTTEHMTGTTPNTVKEQLDQLKAELEKHDEGIFEKMSGDLVSRLIDDVGVSVSKPGSQFGGDAGTAGLRGRRLRVECKRYLETTRLSPRGLAGEIMEAVLKDKLIEAWVLAATKQVSETEQNLARDSGAHLGVPIVVVDWTPPPAGAGLNRLAALCATWPDIVEQHVGKVAADAARALTPHVGATIDNLRRDLEHWYIGFESLRTISLKHLKRVWEDSAESKAALNQDAAGGSPGVHLIERKQPIQQLLAWWLKPADVRTPVAVTGSEGVGKTWVTLDWAMRSSDALPVVVLLGANEFVAGQYLSEVGVKDLLVRTLRTMTRSSLSDEYWRARVHALLQRPASEGAAFLLVVDGLNQQPHVDWGSLVRALQGDALTGKVRLLTTARKHYFEIDLRRFGGLHARPMQVEVGPYNAAEFNDLLRLHGMNPKELHPTLMSLACMPRLFPLVLRLRSNVALQSEASVARLLFEYGRDVLQLRQGSTLTEDDWVSWLVDRAKEYRQRLQAAGNRSQAATIKELAATVDAPHLSKAEVARRLSDVIDGGFFRTVNTPTGAKHVLEERHANLGLGLGLLESLTQVQGPSFGDIQAALERWLEPVAAIDEVVEVLRSSLAVVSAVANNDGAVITDVLLTSWMNAQNPSLDFPRDVEVFGDAFPRSMLTVVEQSTLQSRSAAFHCAIQSLRRLPRSRIEDWDAITNRMLDWCSQVHLPKPKDVADPQHYAKAHQARFLNRIGTVNPGSVVVLGERLQLSYAHPGDAAGAVPGILEGHELSDFMPIFRRASVREAVQVEFRGRCWSGLKWVVMLACRNEAAARAALVKLADQVLATAPEHGVHERLRNRAAALLLRATCDEANEVKARSIDERFGDGWYYDRDYLTDPANSFFALEFRHVQDVMTNAAVPAGRRLDRLDSLLAHPQIALPAELLGAIELDLQQQKFDNVNALGQTTKEERDFERLKLFGARFAHDELAQTTRRRSQELASRQGEQKYWAALAAPEMLLAVGSVECDRFADLRTRSKLASYEQHANTWCLQLEMLHKPLAEQLSLLHAAEDFYFTTDLMAVVRVATAQRLLDFLRANEPTRDKAARVVLEVMAYQMPQNAEDLAQGLIGYLFSDVEEVRAIAFVALSSCTPDICGRALIAGNWTSANDEPFFAHCGSRAVAKASAHLPLADVLAQVATWRWLDAAVARGGKPEELEETSSRLLAVLKAPPGAIPAFDGLLAVRVADDDELPKVSVQELPSADNGDIGAALSRLNEDVEEANKRRQELAKQAAASIQKIRTGGHSLYLHSFSRESVKAAYDAAPALWQKALEGVHEASDDFLARLRSAEGLYMTLCEVLLEQDPSLGAPLWRALRDNLHTQFRGQAGIAELIHIAFRVKESEPVLAIRDEVASLRHCNTDGDLMDLVIAAQLNGQDAWLDGLIAKDSASEALWRRKRAIVVSALRVCPDIDQLHWPEGDKTGSWEALKDHMTRWTNRGAFAMYWWRKFKTSVSADEAFAAWHVFLNSADRRAYAQIEKTCDAAHESSELDRLRALQYELNRDVLERALRKREDSSPSFAEHLFGQDAPGQWLTLDGVRH
ncbi:hypothetical protein [Variovorax sp. LjRoot178]|uniref:hypothetical protein n=1 Tax=Variovorax sp. LjRoot178 TaxID=3342277 RepID=UPI003ED0F5C0